MTPHSSIIHLCLFYHTLWGVLHPQEVTVVLLEMPYLQSGQAGAPLAHPGFPTSLPKPHVPPWALCGGQQTCPGHSTGERLHHFTRASAVPHNKCPHTLPAHDSNVCVAWKSVGWLMGDGLCCGGFPLWAQGGLAGRTSEQSLSPKTLEPCFPGSRNCSFPLAPGQVALIGLGAAWTQRQTDTTQGAGFPEAGDPRADRRNAGSWLP